MRTNKVIFVGEQWGATGSHMTGSDVTGSHVTGRDHVRNRKYVMRMHNRKFRNTPNGTFSPEVIVCACATGTFCITTRVVVQVHGYQRGGKVCACPTGSCAIWTLVRPFHRKLATGSDVISPRIFLSGSTKCWLGVFSTTSVSTPFPGYLPLLFS
jgi:hypothetical protein